MATSECATTCGACGERAVTLHRASQGEGGDTRRVAKCSECSHQPSTLVYRGNRLVDLLPDLPDDSGVVWSDNLGDGDTPEGQDGAVGLVIGPHEWRSLQGRDRIAWRDEVKVEVITGAGPGVGFGRDTSGGSLGSVEVRLPDSAIEELEATGVWSDSVGPALEPIHMKVVVVADA